MSEVQYEVLELYHEVGVNKCDSNIWPIRALNKKVLMQRSWFMLSCFSYLQRMVNKSILLKEFMLSCSSYLKHKHPAHACYFHFFKSLLKWSCCLFSQNSNIYRGLLFYFLIIFSLNLKRIQQMFVKWKTQLLIRIHFISNCSLTEYTNSQLWLL